jgi:hypothetical protein
MQTTLATTIFHDRMASHIADILEWCDDEGRLAVLILALNAHAERIQPINANQAERIDEAIAVLVGATTITTAKTEKTHA